MRTRLLALTLIVAGFTPIGVRADDPPRRGSVLSVRGAGDFEQKPDFAVLDLTVSTSGRTLDAAIAEHKDRATRGLELLRSLAARGVAIERSKFAMSEERPYAAAGSPYNPQPAKPKISIKSYSARSTFSVKLPADDNLNTTITQIADAGLFEFLPLTFKVDGERAALNQARRSAMTDAREQAEAYAEAGGLHLVEITDVTDGEAKPAEGSADMPRRATGSVQIVPPATVRFEASVNVTWRITPR